MLCCRQRNASTAYLNCMNPFKTKGSKHASEAGVCCLRRRPDETHVGQRQQSRLGSKILLLLPKTHRNSFWSKAANTPRKQDFAAFAKDPKKRAEIKGSKHASQARYCCFCQRPKETRRGQRQQTRLGSKILLLLPKTQRNSPRSKAANTPRKKDFAASAKGPMKPTKPKGSNHTSEARFCCFRRRPDETHFGQRQQTCFGKQDFAASAEDPMKLARIKGSKHASEAGFSVLCADI